MSDRFLYSDADLAGITVTRASRLKFIDGVFITKFDENQARDERGRFSTESDGDTLDQSEAIQQIWRDGVERVIGAEPGRVARSLQGVPQELKAAVTKNIAEKLSEFDARQLAGLALNDYGQSQYVALALGDTAGTEGEEYFVGLDRGGSLDVRTNEYEGFVSPGTPEAEDFVRRAAVSELIAQWALTSNNNAALSLAIQEMTAATFGLKDYAPWDSGEKTKEEVNNLIIDHTEVLGAFVTAQYDATQEYLKSEGITSIELFRGMNVSAREYEAIRGNENGSYELSTRPLTSWSTDDAEAKTFGYSDRGVFLSATIPADRIFSLPLTGVGCFHEQEAVVLGGRDTVIASTVKGSYDVD